MKVGKTVAFFIGLGFIVTQVWYTPVSTTWTPWTRVEIGEYRSHGWGSFYGDVWSIFGLQQKPSRWQYIYIYLVLNPSNVPPNPTQLHIHIPKCGDADRILGEKFWEN